MTDEEEESNRAVAPVVARPDWISIYSTLPSRLSSPTASNALCELPHSLYSLFDLAATVKICNRENLEHLAMLTVNKGRSLTMSHHLRATSTRDGEYFVLGVIGNKLLSSSPQRFTFMCFAPITVAAPSDERLLRAATATRATDRNVFASLELLAEPGQQGAPLLPDHLRDVQVTTKSFIFVPPRIALQLLRSGYNYLTPQTVSQLILEATGVKHDSAEDAKGAVCRILCWLWCAQRGLLEPTYLALPISAESADRVAEELYQSYFERELRDSCHVLVPRGASSSPAPAEVHDASIAGSSSSGSSEDEDDSEIENVDPVGGEAMNDDPKHIFVDNAGMVAVNGSYSRQETSETACRYVKSGRWNGQFRTFSIFQRNVTDNTKRWYISILSSGGKRGIGTDTIDLYKAPVTPQSQRVPPNTGWIKVHKDGSDNDAPPILSHKRKRDEAN